jgi:hypothetical protein
MSKGVLTAHYTLRISENIRKYQKISLENIRNISSNEPQSSGNRVSKTSGQDWGSVLKSTKMFQTGLRINLDIESGKRQEHRLPLRSSANHFCSHLAANGFHYLEYTPCSSVMIIITIVTKRPTSNLQNFYIYIYIYMYIYI